MECAHQHNCSSVLHNVEIGIRSEITWVFWIPWNMNSEKPSCEVSKDQTPQQQDTPFSKFSLWSAFIYGRPVTLNLVFGPSSARSCEVGVLYRRRVWRH